MEETRQRSVRPVETRIAVVTGGVIMSVTVVLMSLAAMVTTLA